MEYIVINDFLDRFDNMRHCKAGEVHEPANEERAKQLLALGFIGLVDVEDSNGDEDGLKELGGGYYGLPNGEKVRGKGRALEALKALQGGEADESGANE